MGTGIVVPAKPPPPQPSLQRPRDPLAEGTNKPPPAKRQRPSLQSQTQPRVQIKGPTPIQGPIQQDQTQPKVKPKPKPKVKRRPRTKKRLPNSTGLPSLPAEIIGRIASYLLPPAINTEDGFLPPGELPYSDKRRKWVGAKIKRHAYGGVPSGVRDVLNLALTCKQCDRGVALVVGKVGDGRMDGKKRTMYIAIPKEEARSDPVRQRYVDESNLKKVFDRITESSDTLEKLVIHQCSHDMWDPNLPARLNPFQSTSTSFLKLEHLQLGPNLCEHCTSSLLHLFVGQKYTRQPRYSIYTGRQEDEPEGDDDPNYVHQREAIWSSHGSIPRINTFNPSTTADVASRVVTYEESAAPNLVSLQLFISDRNWTEGNDGEIFDKLLKVVPRPNSIRMLQIWLRENFRWGGMGSSGTVTSYPCKEVKTAEEELTEWAKKEKEKNMTAQERLLAKFQADAAKVIPAAAKRRKLALAAVEIEKEKDKEKDKAEGDIDGEFEEEKSDSPEGTAIKQEMLDVEAELKYEYGSDDESGSPSPSTSGPPKESSITNSERHAIYSHRWTARQCTHILGNVAQAMPDLVGLSVMRKGTLLPEITEGAREIGLEAAIWVEPLSKMDSLQYLDLGLAISGKKEVVDFPIGLSITRSRKGRETAKATGNDLQALKRRKYELDIKKAIEEGDEWRIKVLKTFLIPKLASATDSGDPVSLADAETSAGTAEADEEGSLITWPKSLKSGYIYSADLADRLRGNGLAIPWKVVGRSVTLGEPKKIKF